MSQVNINLSIGYHNIEGQHDSTLGCKLLNQVNMINDIEIFSEMWSDCIKCKKISIENYTLLEVIEPMKKRGCGKGRKSGGIHIFCKSHLKPHIKIKKSSKYYSWLEIDKNLFHNLSKNILACAIYSQPSNSVYYSEDMWDELEHDILNLTTNDTPFLIIGDMNGRVGELSEFSQIDTIDINNHLTRSVSESYRNNCDNQTCKVGKKIVQMCKSYDMQIANGRMRGDFMGNFTHHNKNTGQSAVDLALISDTLYPSIEDFKVLPQPIFSDHCKIVLTIKNMKPNVAKQNNYKWLDRTYEYKWDNNSPQKYLNALKSVKINPIINNCRQRIEAGLIESAGELLQKIFLEAADLSLEKKLTRNNLSKKRKQKKHKKWFDKECVKLKSVVKKAANLKHNQPWNRGLRDQHRKIMREFKNLCKTKKNLFWQNEITAIDNISNENFWEKWKQIGEDVVQNNTFTDNLDGLKWETHFKNLFSKIEGKIDNIMKKTEPPINQILNEKFIMEELISTIKELKNKKAVGPDTIANEFLKLAPDDILKLILDFLNLNLGKGMTCSKWCFDLIALLHKDGPKDDPNNYRGICIMNSLLKILCTLLNKRLAAYCSDQKLINREQIGFLKNNRTSDHILTLKTLVNKYVGEKKGKKLYTCFIDFQKAFDSVWHEGLFRKLENKGINGNFLQLIQDIYRKTKCAVKINNKTTNFFAYEKGVQQGNPLSPLLFNLYINDIFEEIKNDSMVTLDDEYKFNTLMYADDLIIISTTLDGLQKSLNALNAYCDKWKLNINHKKTKSMVFSKGTKTKNINLTINSKNIENTKVFKYLGITINSKNCSFTPTLSDLSSKANKAIYSLLSKMPLKLAPVKTMLKLFDTCITPILLYGSEVWGPFMNHDWKNWDTTQTEKIHTQFLKRLLGLNRSTTNVLTRGELGRHSLQEQIVTRNINYIKYIEMKDPQTLVKQAANYEFSHTERNSLYSLFKKYEQNLSNDNIRTLSKYKLRKLIKEEFDTQWQTQILTFPKADSYRLFKSRVVYENYLTDIKNRKQRVSFTKYRLSDHCLMVEKGRHTRPIIPRNERFCPFCPTNVEDEIHFITQCAAYENRPNLFNKIETEVPNFSNMNYQEKFIFLMSQENKLLMYEIIGTIHKWLTKRLEHIEN